MAKNFLFNPRTYTGEGVDAKTAEIIARELGIPTEGKITVLTHDEYLKTHITPLEA